MRARETAFTINSILQSERRIPIAFDETDSLREIDLGLFNPSEYAALHAKDPRRLEEEKEILLRRQRWERPEDIPLPYGESGSDVKRRVHKYLPDRIDLMRKRNGPNHCAIVVTHMSTLVYCLTALDSDAVADDWIQNRIRNGTKFSHASVADLVCDSGGFEFRGFLQGEVLSGCAGMQNLC